MNLQFTVSNRGSLQVILNRYMYNLHSTSRRSGVKRWRCVEYRNKRCQAFLVTKGNVVLNRANLHNHSFHDKKILGKLEKKAIYSTIDDVKGIRDKDPEDGKDTEKDSDGEDLGLQDYNRLESLTDDDKDQISKAI
ncbi:hypothetical protein EVAR_24035_1 [Eumeta japonica]|uniref:FLYWCH-type domain-containing protein n=1 Tax=Eumeta variegata TaxID=151549 RepID=A0A4C1WCA3_EUMVA|nr:hypothetical protein EVAR_24035_1 [Eumeta japonica]